MLAFIQAGFRDVDVHREADGRADVRNQGILVTVGDENAGTGRVRRHVRSTHGVGIHLDGDHDDELVALVALDIGRIRILCVGVLGRIIIVLIDRAAEAAAPAPAEQPKSSTTTRKPRQKKTDDLPPDNAPAPAAEAAAPAAQQKREVKHIAMSDTDALQQIIDWTMRQPNTEAAIQKISIGYDWEQAALDYVVAQVKERFAFINDLHGQN